MLFAGDDFNRKIFCLREENAKDSSKFRLKLIINKWGAYDTLWKAGYY